MIFGIVTWKSIDFQVTIPGNLPNIAKKICWFLPRFQGIFTKVVFLENFPDIVTRKSIDFWVTIPRNQFISEYCDPEINWFPGNNTRKFSKKTTFVNIPWNLGKNQQIYSEIFGTFPGKVTRKSIDFRVTIPGNQLISGYQYREICRIFMSKFVDFCPDFKEYSQKLFS